MYSFYIICVNFPLPGFVGVPRRVAPVQTPDRAVQSADTKVDSGVPGRRYKPNKKNDRTDQPKIQ